MITIEQLLESVELDFEPRFVTKDKYGDVRFWEREPIRTNTVWTCGRASIFIAYKKLKLAEFENKPWQECIYEVPRKTKEGIVKLGRLNVSSTNMATNQHTVDAVVDTLNQVINAVNEINENYACIAALTDIRKRLDTLEKCVKNQRGEE